ncbi:MAG: Rieske 2Fe-2S domain-containing protein [Gammaproteobacteria bacterium]|nr:Rieske 2Fe-2S domain-containing protein [Gammaproteobacteria bacterium]
MTQPEVPLLEVAVGSIDELEDPGCREFSIGEGDWPLRGFVVRQGNAVFAYQNNCMHVGHPLNYKPDSFLTKDGSQIICASHGAVYDIESGQCTAGPCRGKSLRKVEIEIRDRVIYARGRALR